MHKHSTGRRSSSNPVRVSMLEREDKSGGRNDARRTQILKPKAPTQIDNSHIPRPRIRSSSSERTSIRRSNLKPLGKTPLRQTHLSAQPVRISNAATPLNSTTTPRVSSSRRLLELPTGPRHRSPSAERASGFGAKGPRKDCRPLADKSYQNLMLNKIDQYFYEIQQTSLLNQSGSLKPITLKIFVEATNCLVKLLDIKQDVTLLNYMDDVPKISNKLHYPGIVTKSWLKTANTMHSWPQVLGWLSWLVEVCEAKEKAEDNFKLENIPFVATSMDVEVNRSNFLTLLKMYAAWNAEKLDEEAAIMEIRVREMNEAHGDLDKLIDEEQSLLEKDIVAKETVDKQGKESDDKLLKLNENLKNLKNEEFEELETMNTVENNIKRVNIETIKINVNCNSVEEQIERDSAEHEEMLITIEKQIMSVDKRAELMGQCTDMQNCIRQYDDYIKDIENKLYALDLKFASSNQNLRKAILAYNKDVIIHLGCDDEIDLETLKMPETNILSPDFMDILKAKEESMTRVRESMMIKLKNVEVSITNNSEEISTLKEELKNLRLENEDYMLKAEEEKMCMQKVERDAKKKENKLKENIKQLRNDIENLEGSKPDMETPIRDLAEAQEKLQAVTRRSEFVEKRMEQFFDQFYGILAHHRKDLGDILERLPNPNAQMMRSMEMGLNSGK